MLASETPAVPVARVDPRLALSLAAVYLIWSSTYLVMRVAVQEIPPLLMVSMRSMIAGVVMMTLAMRRGAVLPTWRDWRRSAPVGTLLFVGGSGFVAIAEQSVSSGGAAVVCATMPLWVGVLGAAFGTRTTAREWVSLVLGFIGVVVLLGGPSLAGEPHHVALLIASPILWATGSLLSRRTKDVGGEHAALVGPALQMLTGGTVLVVIGVVRGEAFPVHASATAWVAIAYLVSFGSVLGFTAYAWLLRNARPVVATSYAYVNPILAVLIGAALYGEPLGVTTVVANALIVAAVGLALRRHA